MNIDLRNSRCLWPREAKDDGNTVRLIQKVIEYALNRELEKHGILILCRSMEWAGGLCRWIGETAGERSIFFERKFGQYGCVIHSIDVRFHSLLLEPDRLRGLRPGVVLIDGAIVSDAIPLLN